VFTLTDDVFDNLSDMIDFLSSYFQQGVLVHVYVPVHNNLDFEVFYDTTYVKLVRVVKKMKYITFSFDQSLGILSYQDKIMTEKQQLKFNSNVLMPILNAFEKNNYDVNHISL
tara:strand:- start:484 stop:822 length:339 start_codon:yes stop_codon:yes gene_type:complete